MKSKRNFVAFSGISAILALGVLMYHPKSADSGSIKGTEMDRTLRASYPLKVIKTLDPARIDTAEQAILLMNLYSALVEFTPDGKLVPGLARTFTWNGDEVRFVLRDNIKTLEGHPITAMDAELSLKRLIVLNKNTHGNLANFLCNGNDLRRITDPCDGLRVDGNALILKVQNVAKKPFLIPLLAGPDFRIIPSSALDLNSPNLEILEFRNTSGPFALVEQDGQSKWVLQANPNHYHFNAKMPNRIELLASGDVTAMRLFATRTVDFMTTADQLTITDAERLCRSDPDAAIHRTLPITLKMLHFLPRALRDTTPDQRLRLGERIRTAYLKAFESQGLEPTREYFPTLGDGTYIPQSESVNLPRFPS